MTLTSLVETTLSVLTTVHVVITVAVAVLIYKWLSQRKLHLPPGPPALPLVGNLWDFKGSTLTKKTLEWKGKYGDVVRYELGFQQWVVLSSYEALNEAYIQRGLDFASKSLTPTLKVISKGGSNIGFAPYSEALRYRRKIAMQAMRQYISGSQQTERIHNVVLGCVHDLKAQKRSFDPHTFFSYIIFNLIHDLCFGYSLPMDGPLYSKLLSFFDNRDTQLISFWEDVFPFLIHYPTKKFQFFLDQINFLEDYINKHIKERREKFQEDDDETLIDHIILAQKQVAEGEDEALKSGFTDLNIQMMIEDVFFAGVNTSRHTLDWIFLLLAANQKVQNKIHEEIDRVIGDQVPGREHRSGLVYTEAVILEVLRLFPVVPMGLPHETLCDTKVRGYDIPAKTAVLVNLYAIMRDPTQYENPDSFMPERFLEDDGSKVKTRLKGWIPFSIGPRNCIGEFLAKQNILYSVTGLLQKVHFDLAPEIKEPNLNPEDLWFDLRARPYKVVVTGRGS